MKMHGLGDAPYWVNMYLYFLIVCLVYMFCFVLVGSLTGNNRESELDCFLAIHQSKSAPMHLIALQG